MKCQDKWYQKRSFSIRGKLRDGHNPIHNYKKLQEEDLI